jgi:hypothetical protein
MKAQRGSVVVRDWVTGAAGFMVDYLGINLLERAKKLRLDCKILNACGSTEYGFVNKMKKLLIVFLSIFLLASTFLFAAEAMARRYITNFPLTENPISEKGNWKNGKTVGLDWADIRTAGARAHGTETGSIKYDDATALLTGSWGPDQTVQATVYTTITENSNFEEVELRVRSSLSAHICTGYEIMFSVNPSRQYVEINRWNGASGSWTGLNSRSRYYARNGDVIKATAVGNTITVYLNGAPLFSATDSTYPTGNPGMGFYLQGTSGINSKYGFTNFTASDGTVSSDVSNPPTNLVNSAQGMKSEGTLRKNRAISSAVGY